MANWDTSGDGAYGIARALIQLPDGRHAWLVYTGGNLVLRVQAADLSTSYTATTVVADTAGSFVDATLTRDNAGNIYVARSGDGSGQIEVRKFTVAAGGAATLVAARQLGTGSYAPDEPGCAIAWAQDSGYASGVLAVFYPDNLEGKVAWLDADTTGSLPIVGQTTLDRLSASNSLWGSLPQGVFRLPWLDLCTLQDTTTGTIGSTVVIGYGYRVGGPNTYRGTGTLTTLGGLATYEEAYVGAIDSDAITRGAMQVVALNSTSWVFTGPTGASGGVQWTQHQIVGGVQTTTATSNTLSALRSPTAAPSRVSNRAEAVASGGNVLAADDTTVLGTIASGITPITNVQFPRCTTQDRVLMALASTAAGASALVRVTTLDVAPTVGSVTCTTPLVTTGTVIGLSLVYGPTNGTSTADPLLNYLVEIQTAAGVAVTSETVTPGTTAGVTSFSNNTTWSASAANTYRLRVTTRDQAGNSSTASSWANFTVGTAGSVAIGTPSADVPASGGYTGANRLIGWAYTPGSGGAQAGWEIEVRTGSTSGTVTYSYTANTTTNPGDRLQTQWTVPLVTDVDNYVRVRVTDALGLTSAWSTARAVYTSYSAPPAPSCAVTTGTGYLRVTVTNPTPTGAQPAAVSNTLDRRPTGGAWTRVAVNVAASGTWDDYATASGQGYEYRATAVSASGAMTTGTESTTATLTLPGGHHLHAVADAAGSYRHYPHGTRARSVDGMVTLARYAGRQDPVALYGEFTGETIDIAIEVPSGPTQAADCAALDGHATARRLLCYRDQRGRLLVGAVTGYGMTDTQWGAGVRLQLTRASWSVEV